MSEHYAGPARQRAIKGLMNLTIVSDRPDDITAVEEYFDLLEQRLNRAFDLLAQDNVYSEKSSAAWTLLGETLGRVSSKDEPFAKEAADE